MSIGAAVTVQPVLIGWIFAVQLITTSTVRKSDLNRRDPSGDMPQRMTALIRLSVCLLLGGCAMADFTPYRGAQQQWPVSHGAFVETKYTVPVFFGPPDRPYDVLGYLNAETAPARSRRGMVIAFMARRAKEVGGNGLIVLGTGRQYTGSVSTGSVSGTVYGSGFTATSFGSSVPMFGTGTAIVIRLR